MLSEYHNITKIARAIVLTSDPFSLYNHFVKTKERKKTHYYIFPLCIEKWYKICSKFQLILNLFLLSLLETKKTGATWNAIFCCQQHDGKTDTSLSFS